MPLQGCSLTQVPAPRTGPISRCSTPWTRRWRRTTPERRPSAEAAIEMDHRQSLRIWPSEPNEHPEALNPSFRWGARGAGWGQNPAALAEVGPAGR